jgi:hypothetical protein
VLANVIERVVALEDEAKKPRLVAVGADAEGAACSLDNPENCS